MIHNRMKRWLHITTALSLVLQQITPTYATMQTQEMVDEVKVRSTVQYDPNNNNTPDPFKGALSAFKALRKNHPQLQALKETEPACFISYARGLPEHEKTIEALTEDLKVAGINFVKKPRITAEGNEDGTIVYQLAGNVMDTPINFVIVAGSKKLKERHESRDLSSVRLELEMLAQKTPGFSPTLLPILLENDPNDVLPQFLLNTATIGFQDPTSYPGSCFNLLARLYRLDAQDPYLQAIETRFKEGKVIDDVKSLLTVSPLSNVQIVAQLSNDASAVQAASNTNTPLDPFRSALLLFKNLRTAHPQLVSIKESEPSCFISYLKGVPEQEKLIHTLANHLKEAGVRVLIDIWNNEAETPAFQFAEGILDDKTDFVVLTGAKRLLELYNTKGTSPIKLELGMIAQRATGLSHTILPVLLDGFHKEALPRFLWNTVSIGFQDSASYPASCFNLLARLYRLDSQDPYLQAIESNFKAGKVITDVKDLLAASLTSSLTDTDLQKNPFKYALHSFKILRTQHPKLKALDANRPTAFLSYSWGSPRNEKIVHLMAEHLKSAGINVMLDIWHNTGGTGITQFAEKILDAKTDFIVLNGTKKLIEKYNSQAYSVVKLELGMIAQRATGASQTIIPLLLEDDYKNVLPKFLWNNARVDFRNFENYHLSLFNLLGRLYQLDSHDSALQDIATTFKKKKEQGETIESIAEILNALPLTMDPKVETYLKEAKQGNMAAQFELAMRYDEGQGVEQNAKKATKWYLEAAQQGHAQAQFNLGLRYDTGHGVDKNDNEAFKWYKASADQGNAAAQCNIGYMYEQGRGVNKDEKEAVIYYQLSVAQGHASAKNNLGRLYEEGRGVEENAKEAARLYREAAEQNNQEAQNNLGRLYEEGRCLDKNESEAITWYTRAAEQGHKEAQESLKRMADQGSATAQCNLGDMYEHGRGVGQDDREAVKWYLKAAKQDYTEAQSKLGVVLQTLTELNFEANTLDVKGTKTLAKLLETNDSITSLDVRDNAIGDEGALSLIQSLKGRKGVKVKGLGKFENILECIHNQTPSLNLSEAGLTDKGAETLVSLLASLPHLQALDLSDNKLKAEGMRVLGVSLAIHTSLQQLTLSKSKIEEEEALAFIQSFKGRKGIKVKGLGKLEKLLECILNQISSLNLSGAELSDKEVKAICEGLKGDTFFNILNLENNSIKTEGVKALSEALKGNTFLKELNLQYSWIREEGGKAIAEGLKGNMSLTALNLNSSFIGDEGIGAIGEGLRGNTSLTILNVSSNSITAGGAKALGEALKGNASLKELDISYNNIGAEGGRAIGEGLRGNASLTILNVSSNTIGEEGAKALGEALKGNTSLTMLSLNNNGIGAEGAKALGEALKGNTSLKELDISYNNIGAEGAKALEESIKENVSLKEINLCYNNIGIEGAKAIGEGLKGNTSLTTLNLNGNSVGAEGAKGIGVGLKDNRSLTKLHLYHNSIGEEGAKGIGEGLKGNTSLTMLNLNNNSIGAEGGKAIVESLRGNAFLTVLDLDANGIGAECGKAIFLGLKDNRSITMLCLYGSSIGDEGAKVLGESLKNNASLTSLGIGYNGIGAEGAKAIGLGLKDNASLKELKLENNSIGAEGAKAIMEGLKNTTSLRLLNLNYNSIKDEGAQAIGEGLKGNASLTTLNLNGNSVGAEGAKAIGDGLKGNTSLKELNLQYNSIGAEGGKAIAEGLKYNISLTLLKLDSNSIGDEGAMAFRETLESNTSLTELILYGNSISDEGRMALKVLKQQRFTLKIDF